MIAVTADIHAHLWQDFAKMSPDGRQSRLEEILRALRWVGKVAVKKKATTLVIAGDLFHDRNAVDLPVLDGVARVIRKLTRDLRVILVAGNHDVSRRGDNILSINAFRRHNVTVVDRPTVLDGIGYIPWTNDPTEVRGALKSFGTVMGVIGHFGLDGAYVGPNDFELPGKIKLEDLLTGDFRWALLGHYHRSQIWPPRESDGRYVAYVGSPLQHTWGEAGTKKGFFLVGTGMPKFVENDRSPRFMVVKTAEDAAFVRPNDYVRVEKEELAAQVNAEQVVVMPPAESREIAVRLKNVRSIREAVESYVKKAKRPEHVSRKRLIRAAIELIGAES